MTIDQAVGRELRAFRESIKMPIGTVADLADVPTEILESVEEGDLNGFLFLDCIAVCEAMDADPGALLNRARERAKGTT